MVTDVTKNSILWVSRVLDAPLVKLSVYTFIIFTFFAFCKIVGISRSNHWKCSYSKCFLQNRCSIILPTESIGKILEKCLIKSSFLVKLQAYSLQYCQKWIFSQVYFRDYGKKNWWKKSDVVLWIRWWSPILIQAGIVDIFGFYVRNLQVLLEKFKIKKMNDCTFLYCHVRILEYSIFAWMSRNSLLKTGAISEVWVTAMGCDCA